MHIGITISVEMGAEHQGTTTIFDTTDSMFHIVERL
jgi:hypothetical protein